MYGGDTARAPPERAAARLAIFLLGRFEVVRDDAPIPPSAWRRRRPADLLKVMALTPGRALDREQVIETLWPGKEHGNGANNLHRALYDLRQILGGRWIDLDHGRVVLRDDVWVDVDAFDAAARLAATADRDAAIALYRGDLSPDDPDAPWLERHRARLRATFAEAALPVAAAAVERGDPATAVPLLRRIIDVAPHVEEPHRLLVRALAETGRRADALRQYDACEAALRDAGCGAPSVALRELRDAVQRGTIGRTRPDAPYDGYRRAARRLLGSSDPPPLRGRAAPMLLLESLVERGSGALVLLGERGVGKSRLAVEGARIAQESGALVLAGSFDPALRTPYSGFADLFAEYGRAAGTARDPFATAPGAGAGVADSARVFDAVRAELAALGAGRAVYFLLDDLHGSDEPSASLFHALARCAGALRLMLVATCREDAVHAGTPTQMLLAHLDCERLARGVRVPRLDLAASRQQLGDILGTTPSEALATRFYRLTDGSPFYNEELARAFVESGHVTVPEHPAAAVRERVARLGPGPNELLEAAAVMGRRFDLDVVVPATELTAHDALVAIDTLLDARIVDDDGAGHHFHHSLAHDAIYEALPPPRRAALHRAIADALEQRDAVAPRRSDDLADRLAHHRAAAGQPDRAFGHRVTAGHRAWERGGLREACSAFQGALAIADDAAASGPRRLEVLEALGQVQLALAEFPGALRTFDTALALSDASGWRPGPELRARAHRHAATALLVAGRARDAGARIEQGLRDALLGSGEERAELLQLVALRAWHEGALPDARDAAVRCAEQADAIGDPELAGRARDLAVLSVASGVTDVAERAATTAVAPGSDREDLDLALWENALVGGRACAELELAATAFRERAARRSSVAGVALARAVEGRLAAASGRLDIAEVALRDAHRLSRASQSALVEAWALDGLGGLLTARGHLDEALALLGEGVLVAERARFRRHALLRLHATLARNRVAAGALYAAEDALREASELAARHGDCATCDALFRPELVRVAIARGRVDAADAEARDLERLAAASGGPRATAIARKTRARVLAAEERPADAAAAFLEAADTFERTGFTLEAARAVALAARALRGAGQGAEAEALAARAAALTGVPVIDEP